MRWATSHGPVNSKPLPPQAKKNIDLARNYWMCNTLLDGQLNFWIFYLRIKQCSNQIGKKLAALSLNKVQTFWVLRSLEPEVQRHI